jgi:formaldehyde-activating enzyme involved in methanogenesis
VEPRDRTEAGEEPLVIYLRPNEDRPVNPNTPEGEIRNVAAFAAGVQGASPRRRAVAKAIVWLILLGMGISILVAVVTGVHAL